jgi:hypothetical protein
VPGSGDDAVINISGITVTHSSNVTDSVHSLTSSAAVVLSGGTLNMAGNVQVTNAGLTLQGGTLGNATVVAGTTVTGQSGTLSGVTLNGNLNVSGNDAVTVSNGLTLNSTVTLGSGSSYGELEFTNTQTLGGSGTVILASTSLYYDLYVVSGTTLTFGPNITVQGLAGYIGYDGVTSTVINQGTIDASGRGYHHPV